MGSKNLATKKKTGTKRKPAKGQVMSRAPISSAPRLVVATALRSVVNMAVVVIVSATVLGGLLAVKHFGA